MAKPETAIRWDEVFAGRTKAAAGGGLTEILALVNVPNLISFAGGFPDPSTFPGPELAPIFERLLSDPTALQYAPVAGLAGPRSYMADRLESLEGRRPTDGELIITSGTIEALELLGKSLIDKGDLVFVEGPTYLGAIMAFESFEARVIAIPTDAGGLVVEAVEDAIRTHGRPKLLYTIPDHQNPAGVTLEAHRRGPLIEIARRHGLLIVEDVAYRELGFTEDRLESLWALGPDVVLQAGTFSKTFMPGVRLGWSVGPAEIVASMVWAKQNTDQCAGALGQRLLEEYGRAGGLERQALRARDLYGRRCMLMMNALERHMPDDVTWTRPAGGFFSWLTLPRGIDGSVVATRAIGEGVAVVPGAPFFPSGGPSDNLRLSFSKVDDAAIDDGIRRLASVIASTERTTR
ncbi:MAG: 2-aminoadipate transaminase [Actinomycetota bacterium]|nr:2-aminoadipate transaminase [Actinomycetota bacterium]